MFAKPKFANPKTDIAFKKLFGVQKDSMLTISFLNAILNRQQGDRIVSVDILERTKWTAEEEEAYDVEIDEERCRKSQFETAINEGLKKGRKEGLEKGLQERLEKAKVEIARKMLKNGIDTRLVA